MDSSAGQGPDYKRHTYACEMKLPWSDPGLRELLALAALASLGGGLALAQDDFLFAGIFAAARRYGNCRGAATLTMRSVDCYEIFWTKKNLFKIAGSISRLSRLCDGARDDALRTIPLFRAP